jgi:hypothetical protein
MLSLLLLKMFNLICGEYNQINHGLEIDCFLNRTVLRLLPRSRTPAMYTNTNSSSLGLGPQLCTPTSDSIAVARGHTIVKNKKGPKAEKKFCGNF